jgi:ankyrin repeat protein
MMSKNPDENVMAIVRSLLSAGADANAASFPSVNGFDFNAHHKSITVLGVAVERGKIELVQLLLHAGARVCESSLGSAVGKGDFNMVEILLQAGARITNAVLEKAAWGANIKLLEFLLDTLQSVELNKKYRSIALTEAISCGKLDRINALIDSGAQLIGDHELARAIENASRRGDIHVLRLLLDDGFRYRDTAVEWLGGSLQAAISAGEDAVTAELLAACANVDDQEGASILAAIHRKDADLVQKLLRAGASVNLECYCDLPYHSTHSVLPAAVDWGNCSVIRDVINAGADIDSAPHHERLTEFDYSKTITTALITAVMKKDIPIVQLLIDAGADVNNLAPKVHGLTALEAAVRNNDINMIHYLINLGADLNDEGALLQAAILGNVELIQLLLGARSRPYAHFRKDYGCPTLQLAMRLKKREIIETLLRNKIAVNMVVRQQIPGIWGRESYRFARVAALGMSREKYDREVKEDRWLRFGESALGTSIKEDKSTDLWMVRMILRAGANPNNIVTEGPKHNALLAAIEMNNAPLVQLLLDAGAEANSAATAGIRHTPLQLAAEKGNMEIVQILLKLDADVNAPPADRYGATALQFAAIGGYIGLACLLLKEGAEVNAAPAKVGGRTALEGAAEHGRIDMLQLLLNAGAGIAGPSSYHYIRAMNFASEKRHGAARGLLESYNALWSENVFEPAEIDGKDCGSLEDLQF